MFEGGLDGFMNEVNNTVDNVKGVFMGADDLETAKKILEQGPLMKLKNKNGDNLQLDWLNKSKEIIMIRRGVTSDEVVGFRLSKVDMPDSEVDGSGDFMFVDFIGCNNDLQKFTIFSTKFYKGWFGSIDETSRVQVVNTYTFEEQDSENKSMRLRNVMMLLFNAYLKGLGASDLNKDDEHGTLSNTPKKQEYSWQKKVYVIISPKSGKGLAQQYYNEIEPALLANGFLPKTFVTERENHALEKIRDMPAEELQDYTQILCCGGDGIVNEVINGFYKRAEPGFTEAHLHLRVGLLPGGSACAAMTLSCKRHGLGQSNVNAMWVLTRQQYRNVQIMRVEIENTPGAKTDNTEVQNVLPKTPSEFRYGFLTIACGLTAGNCAKSFSYRWAGESRYKMGGLIGILGSCFGNPKTRMRIYTSNEQLSNNMPKLSEPITEKTQGNWKLWPEEEYLDIIGVTYPYFCSDFNVTHRIKWEAANTNKNDPDNVKYPHFDANLGGSRILTGGDSIIAKNPKVFEYFDSVSKSEVYKFAGVEMQEWQAIRVEITDPLAIKDGKFMIDGDIYDGLKAQWCMDTDCVRQTA